MKKRLICCILILSILFSFGGLSAHAAETAQGPLFDVQLSGDPLLPGGSFSVVLSPLREDISAFVLSVSYSDAVTQVKAKCSDALSKDYTYVSTENTGLSLVYTAAKGCTMSPDGCITLTFRTDTKTILGSAAVRLEITEAADRNAVPLLAAPETHTLEAVFQPPASSDSALLSLTPPVGTLVPAFDPAINEYTLDVPFSYTSLEFEAVPADKASVKVNRKNLGSGGSTVSFKFTVTAEDGKARSIYTVAVTRAEKESTTKAKSKTSKTDSDNSKAETTEPVLQSAAAADTVGADPTETEQAAIHVATEQEQPSVGDPLLIVAIVLISVSAGMGLVLAAQEILRRSSNRNKK